MKPRFIIIGAGISGLALGWYLKKRFGDHTVTILEASDRPGGWIRTRHEKGFLFEEGPRSCRSKGAGVDTLQLVEELGICHEVISASPEAKKRYLYFNGKVQALPHSLFSFLKSPLMKGIIPALWKEWRVAPGEHDESIANFIERRFNKDIAERLMDPLVSGIYAGDIQKLSIRSCFPEIYRQEQEHGSLLKAMLFGKKRKASFTGSPFLEKHIKTPIFSFKNGMETLVTTLHRKLSEEVKLSCPAKTIRYHEKDVVVTLHNAQELYADHVFLAVPAKAAAEFLKSAAPLLEETISKVTCTTVAVVNIGWNRKVLNIEGFGYLVPSSQKQDILGVVFDSSVFAQQNEHIDQTRLTVMIGGMHRPEMERASPAKFRKIAKDAIAQHLGIHAEPDAIHISLAKQAIPQYEVGHQAKLLKIEKDLQHTFSSRVSLIGSTWRGVAVNDCIAEAKKIAERYSML